MGLPVEVNPLFLENQYAIQRSLRFRSSATAYLNRTPSVAGNSSAFTFSFWAKRGALGATEYLFDAFQDANNRFYITFLSDNTMQIAQIVSASATLNFQTTAVFRDCSSWYHFIVSINSAASGTQKCRLWINGVENTVWTTSVNASFTTSTWNTTNPHRICQYGGGGANSFDGYFAEVNFIDGLALTQSSFGQYNEFGVWSPRKYGGSYGNNGFYLPFNDPTSATTLCYDRQLGYNDSTKNNWTPNNISTTAGVTYDAMTDVPTPSTIQNVLAGNYCTWNPVNKNATVVTTDANLSANSGATASAHRMIFGSQGFTTPSYFEITTSGGTTGMVSIVGVGQNTTGTADGVYVGSYSKSFGLGYATNAANWYANGATNANGAATNLVDGTWGFAVDPANGKAWVRNTSGNWIGGGDPAAGTLPTFTWTSDGLPWFPIMSFYNVAATFVVILNAGQRSYAFTAPSGFRPLNTNNLPSPTIPNGARVMAATLYQGNGSSVTLSNGANNTLGTTFQPDFIWTKSRSASGFNIVQDSVRGSGYRLITDGTFSENYSATYGTFSPTGFNIGSDLNINTTSVTYIAWQWNAGSGSSTVPSGGSITPTGASINVSAGFSVITYTGTGVAGTLPHGLGAAPSMVITKKTSTSGDEWVIWHTSLSGGNFILLFTTAAQFASTQYTAIPTSLYLNLNTATAVNNNGSSYISYIWAAVSGYSAFGSYTANASTDGPMVFLNFRPRFVLLKNTTRVLDWITYDSSRDLYNTETQQLYPNLSSAEAAGANIDFLSNGFKIRGASGSGINNTSGDVYIYAAFAENPFKFALAR